MDPNKNKDVTSAEPQQTPPAVVAENGSQAHQADEAWTQGPRIVARDNVTKILFLLCFTTIYGIIVGAFPFALGVSKVIGLYAWFLEFPQPVAAAALAIPHMLVFLAVGFMFRARWIAFIPLLAFQMTEGGLFAGLLPNLDFFHYLARHFSPQEKPSINVFYMASVFILAFIIVLGCRYLTFVRSDRRQARLAAAIVLFGIASVMLFTINKAGTPLYHAELRRQDTIHIPVTGTVFGNASEIIYAPMQHSAGVYQNSDEMSYKMVFPTYERSTRQNCSGNIQKTQAGYDYTLTTTTHYKGNSSDRGLLGEYHEYTYCFVIGSYKYLLSRSDGSDGPAYLQKYPAEDVIDAIHAGKQVVYGCSPIKYYPSGLIAKAAEYCDQSSIDHANKILVAAEQKRTVICENIRYFGSNLEPKCERIVTKGQEQVATQASYREVGRLTVAEWGISIPLTEDTKDAYYIPGSTSDLMRIGLKRYDSAACFAGEQVKSVGGIGKFSKKIDDRNQQRAAQNPDVLYTPYDGKDLGDGYLYGLYVVGEDYRADCDIPDALENTFEWMQTGIKKL